MFDTPPNITSILIALISAIIGPVVILWVNKMIEKNKKLATRKNHIKAYEENRALSQLLENLSILPGVRKAVIIKNTNGGGIPKLGNPIYSSIISPTQWSSSWNHQLTDIQFANLTLDLLSEGKLWIKTNELDSDSDYYTLLKLQNITCSYWEEISISPKSYNFVAVDFYLKKEEIPESVKNSIRIKINEIRNLYKHSNVD